MYPISNLALAAAVALGAVGANAQTLYLSCSLESSNHRQTLYSFEFKEWQGSLYWVEGSRPMTIVRNTSTELWASHEGKFHQAFDYDETYFQLNRVTGAAQVSYLRRPSAEQVRQCRLQRSWGCEDSLVLEEFSEVGQCKVVPRAIN